MASVSVLAKVPSPENISQSRPITLFSTIYRIWSSLVARQILQQWGHAFPHSVMGSMPGRSARDLSYQQQHAIERSLLENIDLYGLSLDIIKCFNCIPWLPAFHMMKKLGVPATLVDCWGAALAEVRKYPVFMTSLGPPMRATTGVPEGDPLSVVAMAALCFCAAHLPGIHQVDFKTYVDNWSWHAKSPSSLQPTTPTILAFLAQLRLQVDWKKTYTWSTTKKGRTWLQGPGQEISQPTRKSRSPRHGSNWVLLSSLAAQSTQALATAGCRKAMKAGGWPNIQDLSSSGPSSFRQVYGLPPFGVRRAIAIRAPR